MARNASKEGFEAEKRLIEALSKYSGVEQNYVFNGSKSKILKYHIKDLCTNLKFYVGSMPLTENDCNITLEANDSFLSRLTRKYHNIDSYENVAIQSKFYSNKIKNENIKHDVNNMLMTPRVSAGLMAHSIVVIDDIPKSYEQRLKYFGVQIVSNEKFARNFDIKMEAGNNRIIFDRFSQNMYEDYNIYLGRLVLAQTSFNNVGFFNLIELDDITHDPKKKKISSPADKLESLLYGFEMQCTYLNPEYYIYSTKLGKIDYEGMEYLDDINAKEFTYAEIEKIFSKGEFFSNVGKIDRKAFGIEYSVLGKSQSELLDRVKKELREKKIKIPHNKIHKAINSLLVIPE